MKKNFLITLSLVIVALLATSCNQFKSTETPIEGTKYAFFTAQDANKLTVFGVKAEQQVIIPAIYQNIRYNDGLFTVELDKKLRLRDGTGKEIADKDFNEITAEKQTAPDAVSYLKLTNDDGNYYYHAGMKLFTGPYEKIIFGKNEIFCQKGDWGITDKTGKEILPQSFKEIIVLSQDKSDEFCYVANNGKEWRIYQKDGKKGKILSANSVRRIKRDAEKFKASNWTNAPIMGQTVRKISVY